MIFFIIDLVNISNLRRHLNLIFFLDCITIGEVQSFFCYSMENIENLYFNYKFEYLEINEKSSDDGDHKDYEDDDDENDEDNDEDIDENDSFDSEIIF